MLVTGNMVVYGCELISRDKYKLYGCKPISRDTVIIT